MNENLKKSLLADEPEIRKARTRRIALEVIAKGNGIATGSADMDANRALKLVLTDKEVLNQYDDLVQKINEMLEG